MEVRWVRLVRFVGEGGGFVWRNVVFVCFEFFLVGFFVLGFLLFCFLRFFFKLSVKGFEC